MFFINILKRKFFHDWFPHWSPDIALRYLPIVNDIKKDRSIDTILDVGSGSLGITPYIKRPVTGVDMTFDNFSSPFLKKIKAPANKLPFKNKTFDASVCADTLEHIPQSRRQEVVKELIRVTKKKVYIVVPCGAVSEREDQGLFTYLKMVNKGENPYLKEHIQYGLPTEKEIMNHVSSKYRTEVNGLTNIYLHRLLLKFQFSDNRVARFISSVIFVLLIPVFLKINFNPTYRKLFLIRITD